MPLLHSKSKEAVGKNIKKLRGENFPLRQSIAIALEEQRRNKKKKK